MLATAPPAQRFVLVEQPGAWGRNAVSDWRHRDPAFTELLARCRRAEARLVLVRRLHRDPEAPRRWAVADARPGRERMWWGTYDVGAELAGLDPLEPEGTPSSDPVLLVCTHGRRDVCCAQRGWPVVAALSESHPEWTWQCSHVGGDRFAANLVVLPHGLYYGRLTPTSVEGVLRGHLAGNVRAPVLRGRSCFPTAVQAAQHYARAATGLEAIDALAPLDVRELGDGSVDVLLAASGDQLRVLVASHLSPPIPRLTCGAVRPSSVAVWELRSIESA